MYVWCFWSLCPLCMSYYLLYFCMYVCILYLIFLYCIDWSECLGINVLCFDDFKFIFHFLIFPRDPVGIQFYPSTLLDVSSLWSFVIYIFYQSFERKVPSYFQHMGNIWYFYECVLFIFVIHTCLWWNNNHVIFLVGYNPSHILSWLSVII